MKIHELAAIAARIFAICLFLYALRAFASLAGSIGPATPGNFTVSISYFLGIVVIPLIIAVAIWKFPLTLASAFLPRIKSEEVEITDSGGFLSAALIVLGVYVLTYAIPDLLYNITTLYMVERMRDVGTEFPDNIEVASNLVATLVELIIGCWLILGNRGVLSLIAIARGRAG